MIKRGIKDALPVMAGYFPIAMTFGILANSAGVQALDGTMFSILVYAGASQFMAISMIASGMGYGGIVLAVFFMNFRHFIMSASVRSKLKKTSKRYFPVIGFYLTDETYSVVSMKDEIDDPGYLIALELSCHASWVAGTISGYLFGMFIPEMITQSMGIALYALLLALLVPSWKKERTAIAAACLSGGLNALIPKLLPVDPSTSFILSVILTALSLTVWKALTEKKREAVAANEC